VGYLLIYGRPARLRDFIQIKKIPALGQEAESALSGLREGENKLLDLPISLITM